MFQEMAKNKFKFMTLLMATFCLLASLRVHSANDLVIQEKLKSHLRWNFFVNKDEITISKKNNRVIIKTLNSVLLNKIFKSLSALDMTSGHISKIEKLKKSDTSNLENIIISLTPKDIEIFNFYPRS